MKVIKKKKEKKEKIRIKERRKGRKERPEGFKVRNPFSKHAAAAGKTSEKDRFGANVYSDEPILRLKDVKEQAAWKQDLVLNCSCALLVTTALALFCMFIDSPELIPFVLACPVVFMIIATIGSVKPGVARWLAAGVVSVILLAVAIVWRSDIFGGLSELVNMFYDTAEEAQAYVYDRLAVDSSVTEGSYRVGMTWISALMGMAAALPPVKVRRAFSGLIAIAIMLALAYYGMEPSSICIAVMIAALIAAVSRGNIKSILPVALAALLLFGAVVLVDPGESYTVSRINENLRDRFALHSALLETDESLYDETEEDFEEDMEDEEDPETGDSEETSEYGKYALYGLIILAVAALGITAFLLIRRFIKKRAQNRRGINSDDSREAVTAMFPYAVRWLKGYGIEQPDPSFSSMEHALKKEFSDTYSDRFMDMYDIWNEAAYSDHDVTEESRISMEAFVEDTVAEVNKKCKLRDKLRLTLRYAL